VIGRSVFSRNVTHGTPILGEAVDYKGEPISWTPHRPGNVEIFRSPGEAGKNTGKYAILRLALKNRAIFNQFNNFQHNSLSVASG
jgi:hypothetical protein